MPHFVQAKRDVSGHVVDREGDIPEGHVVEADSYEDAMDLVNTNHFIYRGEHNETPPSLSNPLDVPDPTVYSDAEVPLPDEDEEDEVAEREEDQELDVDEGEEGRTTPGQPEHPLGDDEVDDQRFGDSENHPGDELKAVNGIGPKRSSELTEEYGIETVGQLAESDEAPEHLVEKAQAHINE